MPPQPITIADAEVEPAHFLVVHAALGAPGSFDNFIAVSPALRGYRVSPNSRW